MPYKGPGDPHGKKAAAKKKRGKPTKFQAAPKGSGGFAVKPAAYQVGGLVGT